MRGVGLVLSLLVTVSVAAVALTYVPGYVGQHRIYIQGRLSSSPDATPYHAYGYLGKSDADTARAVSADLDPYHQRYYSESEGWTYYALPSGSSGH